MEAKRLSFWDMYCFLMNAMIGAGVLAIPHAFQSAGVLSSSFILLVVSAIDLLLQFEVLAVTEKLTIELEKNESFDLSTSESLVHAVGFTESPHQLDLSEIVRSLLDSSHWFLYFVVFSFYSFGTVGAYYNIFGTAFGTYLYSCDFTLDEISTECMTAYHTGLILFALIAGLLTVLDYHEQAYLQYAMTVLQLMVVGSIIGYAVSNWSNDSLSFSTAVYSDFPSFRSSCSTIVFASVYHSCVPSLLAVAERKHSVQRKVAWMMAASTSCIYGLLGVVSVLGISHIPENASLIFQHDRLTGNASTVMTVVGTFVLLAPVCDICTNAPVYCQSLAGIITSSIFGTNHVRTRQRHPWTYVAIRLCTVFPPFLIAWYYIRLGHVISFSGYFLIVLLLVYMPICYNIAMTKIHARSAFEIRWKGIKWVNYGISALFAVFFLSLMWDQV